MILVTGASGQFGQHTIDELLDQGVKPSEIVAMVRSEEKAASFNEKGIATRIADYTDYDSLVRAFEGIDALMFVSGSEIETRDTQHKNVVKAAKEAGVGRIVYTSFLRNTPVESSAIAFLQSTHEKTENWIKESGIDYTILQNALYMDMLPMFVGEAVVDSGMIMLPAQNGKSSSVLRKELAEAAAHVLATDGHENKIYPLANNESASYEDIAAEISKATGKNIQYTSPAPEDFQATLKKHNVPDEYIGLFTAFSVAQANGELESNNGTLEQLLGRKPQTHGAFIATVYN